MALRKKDVLPVASVQAPGDVEATKDTKVENTTRNTTKPTKAKPEEVTKPAKKKVKDEEAEKKTIRRKRLATCGVMCE